MDLIWVLFEFNYLVWALVVKAQKIHLCFLCVIALVFGFLLIASLICLYSHTRVFYSSIKFLFCYLSKKKKKSYGYNVFYSRKEK
jgi:hypothetical protein